MVKRKRKTKEEVGRRHQQVVKFEELWRNNLKRCAQKKDRWRIMIANPLR